MLVGHTHITMTLAESCGNFWENAYQGENPRIRHYRCQLPAACSADLDLPHSLLTANDWDRYLTHKLAMRLYLLGKRPGEELSVRQSIAESGRISSCNRRRTYIVEG